MPAAVVDADGAYIEYKAMWSADGEAETEPGRYLSASECVHRRERAFASPGFNNAIHQHAIQELLAIGETT